MITGALVGQLLKTCSVRVCCLSSRRTGSQAQPSCLNASCEFQTFVM
jgi:hypothetical protein